MMELSKKNLKKVKKIIKLSKDKKIVKPHIEAFKEFPIIEEDHKGKKKYYTN